MIDPMFQTIGQTAYNEQAADAKSGQSSEDGFDEVFARLLVQEVRRAMPEDGMLGGSGLAGMFAPMIDDALVQALMDGGVSASTPGPIRAATHAHSPALGHGDGHGHHDDLDIHQLVDGGKLTSHFGHRADPFTKAHKMHNGVDIAAPMGSPIQAARAGVVTYSGDRGGYGNVVIIDHGDGNETRYAHCERLDVQPGQRVAAGEVIATVGSTGRSTGPHLHFELRQNGQAVAPSAWLSGTDSDH